MWAILVILSRIKISCVLLIFSPFILSSNLYNFLSINVTFFSAPFLFFLFCLCSLPSVQWKVGSGGQLGKSNLLGPIRQTWVTQPSMNQNNHLTVRPISWTHQPRHLLHKLSYLFVETRFPHMCLSIPQVGRQKNAENIKTLVVFVVAHNAQPRLGSLPPSDTPPYNYLQLGPSKKSNTSVTLQSMCLTNTTNYSKYIAALGLYIYI